MPSGGVRCIVQRLECACSPGKVFATASTLRKHKQSQRHKLWEVTEDNRTLRADLQAAENRCRQLEKTVQELVRQPIRRRVTERVKKMVAAEQQWRCSSCDALLTSSFQVDHTVALWKGGTNDRSNLSAMCPTCHANKTQLDLE